MTDPKTLTTADWKVLAKLAESAGNTTLQALCLDQASTKPIEKVLESALEAASQRLSTPQVIIAWNQGAVLCEGPSANGSARDKIEGISFDELPASIQASLIAQRDRNRATIQAQAPKRPSAPTLSREERIEKARADHARAWQQKFDASTFEEQQLMLFKRHQAEEKRKAEELAHARQVWWGVHNNHGRELADRVITDPKRRPRAANAAAKKSSPKPKSKSSVAPVGAQVW